MEFNRDKAVEVVGGSQFDLVLLAATRARELKQGADSQIETKYREGITALIEIQEGLYTKKDYLDTLAGKRKPFESKENEDDQSF